MTVSSRMATFDQYFSFQVFLIVLRETLELAIIISVLLAFLHQSFVGPEQKPEQIEQNSEREGLLDGMEPGPDLAPGPDLEPGPDSETYQHLKIQVWVGGLLGLTSCLVLGSVILRVFYVIGSDLWAVTEHYWEGTFSIIASLIISFMGIKILRVNKMEEKWRAKLGGILRTSPGTEGTRVGTRASTSPGPGPFGPRASGPFGPMFILPFITTLREGMEAIVFIGGIGINENTSITAIVISTLSAIIIGVTVGILLYGTGNRMSLQWFLISSTGFLYLVAGGLFSKGVWNFELQNFIDLCDGFDVSETGHGPGSYDIATSVWHVNCCNGELQDDGALWMIFTAVFGWTNSATYGSVISYMGYWVMISGLFTSLLYEEKYGYLPVVPVRFQLRRIRKRLEASRRQSLAVG